MFEAAEIGASLSKEEYEDRVPALRVDLINAQYDLRTADFPVLLQIAGDDLLGCNEVINLLNEWMDARYIRTHVFHLPSEEEKQRPRFWRYWRASPSKGHMSIYGSAWTVQAIADRITGRIGDADLDRRIDHIDQFEQALTDDGALMIKIWLHLPKAELRKRLKKAKKDKDWAWRVDERDARIYDNYDEGMKLAQRVLRRTSTADTPWQVVESTDPRHRDFTVGTIILTALTQRLGQDRSLDWSRNRAVDAPPTTAVLDAVDLSETLPDDKYRKKLTTYQARLGMLTRKASAAGITSVLVFEGWDAAGKGGVIRRMTRAMDARDYQVVPISAPTEEEKAHHYLWRFWRHLPLAGKTLIFDRSWYGRVLVERVEAFASEAEWRRAYSEINDFEAQLVEHGIVLLKFWLHIDAEEQMRRFDAREQTPYKKYKITREDYRNRAKREQYEVAVAEMVARTSTDVAPWALVPANDKRFARVQVAKTLCRSLKKARANG